MTDSPQATPSAEAPADETLLRKIVKSAIERGEERDAWQAAETKWKEVCEQHAEKLERHIDNLNIGHSNMVLRTVSLGDILKETPDEDGGGQTVIAFLQDLEDKKPDLAQVQYGQQDDEELAFAKQCLSEPQELQELFFGATYTHDLFDLLNKFILDQSSYGPSNNRNKCIAKLKEHIPNTKIKDTIGSHKILIDNMAAVILDVPLLEERAKESLPQPQLEDYTDDQQPEPIDTLYNPFPPEPKVDEQSLNRLFDKNTATVAYELVLHTLLTFRRKKVRSALTNNPQKPTEQEANVAKKVLRFLNQKDDLREVYKNIIAQIKSDDGRVLRFFGSALQHWVKLQNNSFIAGDIAQLYKILANSLAIFNAGKSHYDKGNTIQKEQGRTLMDIANIINHEISRIITEIERKKVLKDDMPKAQHEYIIKKELEVLIGDTQKLYKQIT